MVSTDTQKRAYGDTYDVHVKLGKGAFGVVVKALHISEQRWYAIKLLAKGILSSADRAIAGVKCPKSAERQLKQEIVVLTVLRHPNIIQFKEVVEDDRGIGERFIMPIVGIVYDVLHYAHRACDGVHAWRRPRDLSFKAWRTWSVYTS